MLGEEGVVLGAGSGHLWWMLLKVKWSTEIFKWIQQQGHHGHISKNGLLGGVVVEATEKTDLLFHAGLLLQLQIQNSLPNVTIA